MKVRNLNGSFPKAWKLYKKKFIPKEDLKKVESPVPEIMDTAKKSNDALKIFQN